MAKCFSCGKEADAKEDLCHGCWKVTCLECVNKYDHFGNGKHGRRRTRRAPDARKSALKKVSSNKKGSAKPARG